MGCSFISGLQDAAGSVADMVAPVVAAIPGPWQVPAMAYIAISTVENGGSLGDVIKKVGTAYIAGQIGGAVGAAGDAAGAAATYGTELGSAQTAMLAAQDAGMGTLGDIAGNIAGGVAKTAVMGGNPLQALITGGVGAGVGELTGQIPGFNDMSPLAQKAVTTAIASELQGKDPSQALIGQALTAGLAEAKAYTSAAPYNYNAATNPADPNADSNLDLNGTVADNIPVSNLPTTDYTLTPNYGLSSGVDNTSGLTPPTATDTYNSDGTVNYTLAEPTISEGLTTPIAPNLSTMGGGYGFITPVDGGYMTSLGFVPDDASSVLGDPKSFINDPNVLGKTVISTDTIRAPTSGVSATPAKTAAVATPVNAPLSNTTGAAPFTVTDPAALPGGYKTVGKAGYEVPNSTLNQLYSSLLGGPTQQYSPLNQIAPSEQTISQLQNYNQSPYYARGGLVQHFAGGSDGVGVTDSSTTTTRGPDDLAAGLKALSDVGSGLKTPQHNLRQVGQMGFQYAPKVLPQLAALLRSRGMSLADGGRPDDHEHPNYDGTPVFRTGGLDGLGGKYVEGKGDGTSDDISAMLANGEYVFSADVVSALGNGSNKAGADKLGEMVEAIRARARSAPPDKLPPDAKSPLEYLKSSKGKKHG